MFNPNTMRRLATWVLCVFILSLAAILGAYWVGGGRSRVQVPFTDQTKKEDTPVNVGDILRYYNPEKRIEVEIQLPRLNTRSPTYTKLTSDVAQFFVQPLQVVGYTEVEGPLPTSRGKAIISPLERKGEWHWRVEKIQENNPDVYNLHAEITTLEEVLRDVRAFEGNVR